MAPRRNSNPWAPGDHGLRLPETDTDTEEEATCENCGSSLTPVGRTQACLSCDGESQKKRG